MSMQLRNEQSKQIEVCGEQAKSFSMESYADRDTWPMGIRADGDTGMVFAHLLPRSRMLCVPLHRG